MLCVPLLSRARIEARSSDTGLAAATPDNELYGRDPRAILQRQGCGKCATASRFERKGQAQTDPERRGASGENRSRDWVLGKGPYTGGVSASNALRAVRGAIVQSIDLLIRSAW